MDVQGKYRLLVIRSKYLKSTLDESESMFQKAFSEFTEELGKKLGSSPITKKNKQEDQKKESKKEKNKPNKSSEPIPPPPEPSTDEQGEERVEAKKEEKDQNLKKVFKKIAIKTHPDKLLASSEFEREYKTGLFEKAKNSFDNNDYYGIVQVAEELGIDPPPPTQGQIDLMRERNKVLENKINEIKNTVIWNWYHGEDDTRELLMENYIEKLREIHSTGS